MPSREKVRSPEAEVCLLCTRDITAKFVGNTVRKGRQQERQSENRAQVREDSVGH